MSTRTTRTLPAKLERTRRRFERWRGTRRGHARIPEMLWGWAIEAVGQYGLSTTARALGLDYYALKKHVAAAGSSGPRGPRRRDAAEDSTRFIELVPAAVAGTPECLLEWEDPRGAKMRIHLKGVAVPDVTALSQSFWSSDGRHGAARRRPT